MENRQRKKYKLGSGMSNWKGGQSYEVTFIVTEDCNLRCKYCYQVKKNNRNVMSFDIAKKAVDYVLNNESLYNFDAVIWNFIGGEPFLEIDLIDKITDYIKIQTYIKKHKWFSMHRFCFSSNGILYGTEEVQKYIKKNQGKCSIGISIDGTKQKHDLQRVYPDGRGSYDDVIKNIPLWISQNPGASTKVTIGHDDLPYVKDSIIHLWNLGMSTVPANVVFEDVWKKGDDILFENQLKELADYIIDNKLWNKFECTLFGDSMGYANSEESLNQNHCGAGKMLAIDPKGNLLPCLRYADYSLENKQSYIIGNVNDGIDFDKLRGFFCLNTKVQSDLECIECEVATGCAWCQANNYDNSVLGSNFERCKYICDMHKAQCRANNYYWGRLEDEFGIHRESYGIQKKHLYMMVSDSIEEHCNYISSSQSNEIMSQKTLYDGYKFAYNNFFKPIIMHSKNLDIEKNLNFRFPLEKINIYGTNYNNEINFDIEKDIQVITQSDINKCSNLTNIIFVVEENDLQNLASNISILLENVDRINLNIKYSNKFNLTMYKEQLNSIVDILLEYFKKGIIKEINVITDTLYIKKMDNCEFGENNFALGPNGKIYICPAFYFEDKNSFIGSLEEGINLKDENLFKFKNAPICKNCDNYQCNRCVFFNRKYTNEFNIPSSLQCRISSIERNASILFREKALKKNINIGTVRELNRLPYEDPIAVIMKNDLNPYKLKSE
ncbi:radical SAM peptide maturase, CXXX-repeat target family [Clostridium botulinum]|nr:radical SAM peptide maturase, CXXX-repeat target family [Clostridium botulinum]EKO2043445.1 radical SAM peptide maturase, CXXX-repeat target family [Clostridium botulinum]